jgi:hypothetical protein
MHTEMLVNIDGSRRKRLRLNIEVRNDVAEAIAI